MNKKWKIACHCAVSDGVPRRSFYVALVVGTILNLINQGDVIFGAGSVDWLKVMLTYFVPYAVCTYGAASAQAGHVKPSRQAKLRHDDYGKTAVTGAPRGKCPTHSGAEISTRSVETMTDEPKDATAPAVSVQSELPRRGSKGASYAP